MDSHLIAAMELADLISTLLNIGKVAVGLGFVIFIHELGHFLAAKACGVKCEKFYVGFDPPITIFGFPLPRTLGKFTWGETEYGIGIIPLGGYVKMLGQDDDPRLASQEAERERIQASAKSESDEDVKEAFEDDAVVRDEPTETIKLDPRSFPAKTVPQRMLIISAGVIMNLVSAIFLAAAAYGLGVAYLPCELSGTTPGDPAWNAGIGPNNKVIQVGKDNETDEHLRFVWELRQRVAFAGIKGDQRPMDLLIRKADGEPVWMPVKPSDRMKKLRRFGTLGVLAPTSNRIGIVKPSRSVSAAKQATPSFKNGDLIVAVNGVSLDRSSANEKGELRTEQIESLLYQQFDQPARLTIERPTGDDGETEQITIVVPAPKYRDTGLRMRMGPIVATRIGGPAEAAGIQVGDVIQAVNGKPVENAVTLNLLYGRLVDEDVTLTVNRMNGSDGTTLDIKITPETPDIWQPASVSGPGAFHSLETLGLAYSVLNTVDRVVPDSPAFKSGLKSGDVLATGEYVSDKEAFEEFTKRAGGKSKSFEIGENEWNWVWLDSQFQFLPEFVELSLTYQRGNALGTARISTVESDLYFSDRGIPYTAFSRIHTASSAGEAMSLGWRETKEKFVEVLSFLGLLFQGKISPTNLGGPVRIAQLAGSEASVSIARLLLFLTFLSCNLAIINFLPIPALDGGHMVFLIWEGVTGRPPNERVQMTATLIGFVFLLSVIIFVIGNDVIQSFFS